MLHGTGDYDAYIVFDMVPRERVERMLPKDGKLELMPHRELPPSVKGFVREGYHPVIYVFGIQKDVTPSRFRIFDWNYMEFALSIPSVQWTSPDRALYRGPFFFTPRLYLNKTLPILLGYFYGLDKERGSMGRSNREYIVNDGKLNNPIIEGIFSPNGDMVSASHYPHLSAIVDDLNQPIIAQYHLGSLRGPFVASTFTWHIKKASLQPAAADILVFQDFLDGVVPDSSQAQLKVPPVQNFCEQVSPFHFRKEALSSENPLGVFRICTKWDYSFPFPAGLLRPKNGMLLGGASPETDLDRVPFEKRSLLQSIFSRGRK